MKRQLIFALIAGSHRHRYTDTSGRCAACHRMHSPHKYEEGTCTVCGFAGCDHPNGSDNGNGTHRCRVCGLSVSHVWEAKPTETRCQRCKACYAEQEHKWDSIKGTCKTCNYECLHPEWNTYKSNATHHFCKICGKAFPHTLVFNDGIVVCQKCSICDYSIWHTFLKPNESNCGTCSKCNKEVYKKHSWIFHKGECANCGYKCKHPTVEKDVCTVCGYSSSKPDAPYEVLSGTYEGAYAYAGKINEQAYYRQYIYSGDKWVEGQYYMVVLDIDEPTQFGGEYAYTASGKVFVTSVDNFPINNTLLSGNGKYNVTLKQYTLDGTLKAEGSYTSQDCKDMKFSW